MKKCEIVSKGDRFGHLVVNTEPYFNQAAHRRQHVDCLCDCGTIRKEINSQYLKRGTIIYYCGFECPLYKSECPLRSDVPEESKKIKVDDVFGKLTIIRDAFYHKFKGESVRMKCVEVKCECGNTKIYREDKVLKGVYKSCGCTWERQDKPTGYNKVCADCKLSLDTSLFDMNKSFCKECSRLRYIFKTYQLTKDDYDTMLKAQNYQCYICKSTDSNSKLFRNLCVDHNHDTNQIRGLLCDSCNRGLGYFKENISNLEGAISYLKKFNVEPA